MINESMKKDKLVGMIQPRNSNEDTISPALYDIGCLGKITSFKETDDGRYLIELKGLIRFQILKEINSNLKYREFEVDYDDLKVYIIQLMRGLEGEAKAQADFYKDNKGYYKQDGRIGVGLSSQPRQR